MALFALIALSMPYATCVRPEGSNQSHERNGLSFFVLHITFAFKSDSDVHSSPMDSTFSHAVSNSGVEISGPK